MPSESFRERLLEYRNQDSDIGRLADDLFQCIQSGEVLPSCQSFREIYEHVRCVHGKSLDDREVILLAANLPMDSSLSDEAIADMLGDLLYLADKASESRRQVLAWLNTPICERFGWLKVKAKEPDGNPSVRGLGPACAADGIKVEEISEGSQKVAMRITEHGDVLKFLVLQAQKNHIGDTDVLKHLLASIACTNSLTSAGIQPELNGEKGHGKTDAVRAVFHLIPEKWKLSASVSAKSLYYHEELLAGSIIFSDDVQWSEDLITTVKRSMGSFQEPQTHFTLDKNRNPIPQVMPPRLVWWLSSVESVADDQLKDRQYSLDIDEGKDHSREVSDYLKNTRSQKKVRFSVDRGIEIAREIIFQIKEHEPFKVVIDCAAVADWKVKEDHRTQNKFWDLVEAFAILRFKQRYIDEEGWLHASVEDFNEAKTIFMRRKANHRTHLTNAQTKIVQSVIALQNEPDGATQATIAQDLGISQQAVSKGLKAIVANTRFLIHSLGVHGEEFYKCMVSGLEVIYGEGDIVTLPDGYNDLQPSYNHLTTVLTTTKTTNINNKQLTIQPNIEKHSNGVSEEVGEVSAGKVCTKDCYAQKNGCKVVKAVADSEKVGCKEVVEPGCTIICAKCGEDLTGHGSITKGGKVYCAKVGCGYPTRKEANAN